MIRVSIGLLLNSQGQFLLSKRPPDKPMGNLWEFPGGKIENLETSFQALKRELKEELNIKIFEEHTLFLDHIEYCYPSFLFKGEVFICKAWKGKIQAVENQSLNWVFLSEILSYNILPTCTLIHNLVLQKTDLQITQK